MKLDSILQITGVGPSATYNLHCFISSHLSHFCPPYQTNPGLAHCRTVFWVTFPWSPPDCVWLWQGGVPQCGVRTGEWSKVEISTPPAPLPDCQNRLFSYLEPLLHFPSAGWSWWVLAGTNLSPAPIWCRPAIQHASHYIQLSRNTHQYWLS